MTYYFINDRGLIQKQVGGAAPNPPFVAVDPSGIMRKFDEGGIVTSVIPITDSPLKDLIEPKNAAMLLGATTQRRMRKTKAKSKRKTKRCRCK